MDQIKHHTSLLQIIENFKKSKRGKFISNNRTLNGLNAKFESTEKGFAIKFKCDFFLKKNRGLDVGQTHNNIQIQFGDKIYILENLFLGTHSPPFFTGHVDRVHTKGYSLKRKYYYQLVIPLKKELKFHFNIEQTNFTTDIGYRSRNATTAIIKGELIQACCVHTPKKEYFLVIDSEAKQNFKEFSEKANALKVAIGYLSGYYVGDQGYFFTYTSKNKITPQHFRSVRFRNSINSGYLPVYSNAYGYLHKDPIAKRYNELLRPVSLKEFSVLCEQIYDSMDFASMIMLILESSVASLLFMPGGFAIALETMADIVIGNSNLNLSPIKDKGVARRIRKDIIESLEKYKSSILPDDFIALSKRVDQLNQVTNRARLKAPFDLLNIILTEADLKILETRNEFLHGRIPDITSVGIGRTTDRINKDLYYASMRLFTLLNLLIMKSIGYDNRIVNYPKIQEKFTQIILNEDPFRQV